jgi:hypothetical protein
MQALSSLDTYSVTKLSDEFTQRSASGGALTVLAYLLGAALFVQEFRLYRSVERVTDLFVDTHDAELMPIHLDITFHRLPCGVTGLDVENLIGESEENIAAVTKTRLDASGNKIGEEDRFATEKPSTEIPVWEKQRMAQQAEFERELLRQAEVQQQQGGGRGGARNAAAAARLLHPAGVGREGVRRRLLSQSSSEPSRQLAATEEAEVEGAQADDKGQQVVQEAKAEAMTEPEAAVPTPPSPSPSPSPAAAAATAAGAGDPAAAAPAARSATALQEVMKEKLAHVTAEMHHHPADAAATAEKPTTSSPVVSTVAALTTEGDAATPEGDKAKAKPLTTDTEGDGAELEGADTGGTGGKAAAKPKALTPDEELKQLTEYYHIPTPPPPPTRDPGMPSHT